MEVIAETPVPAISRWIDLLRTSLTRTYLLQPAVRLVGIQRASDLGRYEPDGKVTGSHSLVTCTKYLKERSQRLLRCRHTGHRSLWQRESYVQRPNLAIIYLSKYLTNILLPMLRLIGLNCFPCNSLLLQYSHSLIVSRPAMLQQSAPTRHASRASPYVGHSEL